MQRWAAAAAQKNIASIHCSLATRADLMYTPESEFMHQMQRALVD